MTQASLWPYFPVLERLALALAVGLFVGLEREWSRKEAGIRTFGFVALLGSLGGLLGEGYALMALGLVGVLVIFLNAQTLVDGSGVELTTSAALMIMAFAGVLCGQGHTLTPAALGVVTAALLAWKERLARFSVALTLAELRSAILLGVLAFVVYPALPRGALDRWDVIEPRGAWITVILIAGIGFVNYILLKLYGARGVELAGFLGGLVNSSVAVTDLAARDRDAAGGLTDATYRGVVLASMAALARNAALLGILAPRALITAAPSFVCMLAVASALLLLRARDSTDGAGQPELRLASPFSVTAALKFGAVFLALQAVGVIAQRQLGQVGFYGISLIGGLISSASAVAAAAALGAHGALPLHVAATGAVLASLSSTLVNLPLVARVARDRRLTVSLTWATALVLASGGLGAVATYVVVGMR